MLSLLALLGRQARWALPAGVFIGIALPGLASLLRPLLTAAVIGTLTAALLRLDWSRFLEIGRRRPLLPAGLALWHLVASPLLVWYGTALAGMPPDLRLALLLQAAAPPIGSAAGLWTLTCSSLWESRSPTLSSRPTRKGSSTAT